VALALGVPVYAAIRMGVERANTDLMFISTLTPRSIVWGKFVAALVLAGLILSVCTPFMVFAYLMRGIDLPTIFICLLLDVLVMLAVTMAALMIASLPGGAAPRIIIGVLALLQMIVYTVQLVFGSVMIIIAGAESMGLRDFWGLY